MNKVSLVSLYINNQSNPSRSQKRKIERKEKRKTERKEKKRKRTEHMYRVDRCTYAKKKKKKREEEVSFLQINITRHQIWNNKF